MNSEISPDNLANSAGASAFSLPLNDLANVAPAATTAPPEPPRALSPGALLHGEYEIKSVVSRGLTNIYEAQYGDYGATNSILIAERDAPNAQTLVAPPLVSSTGTAVELTATSVEDVVAQNEITTVDDAASSGAFVEDIDTLPTSGNAFPVASVTGENLSMSEVVPLDESDPTGEMSRTSVPPSNQANEIQSFVAHGATSEEAKNAATAPFSATQSAQSSTGNAQNITVQAVNTQNVGADENAPLASKLFAQNAPFSQEEREYLVFEFVPTTALQDFREPTNDERLLQMLNALAQGLKELSTRQMRADFTTETLRVNANGELKFFGFVEANRGIDESLQQLRSLMAFLLKRVFAESSTMRLDDEFGSLALTEEVKTLARRINDHEGFLDINEAADAISAFISSTRLRVDSAIASDVGQERELNEDAGFILKMQRRAHLGSHDLELFVVADGMGGHEGGEVASDLTLSSLQRHFDERLSLNWNDNVAVRNALVEIIDQVNADVVALTETPKYKGTRAKPGSTLVFGLRLGARVFVGNVGDSRAYKISNGVLERISKDHSYVQTLIDRGEITDDEAFDHPEGSVITAHIGFAKLKQRDVFLRLFSPGDKLLLVSDGVTDMLRDREYAPHIASNDPHVVCQSLVDAANAAGGADNITVVCAQFSG